MYVHTQQKQIHMHRKQTYGYQRRGREGTIQEYGINRYKQLKTDKQQRFTMQHWELYPISYNNL